MPPSRFVEPVLVDLWRATSQLQLASAQNDVYRAAREQAAWVDLSSRELLRVTGPDRVSFVQGMVTNDVTRGILEKTRGDLTFALRQDSLERELARVEQELQSSGRAPADEASRRPAMER